MHTTVLNVGDRIKVKWSNGAGYSVYEVVDNPEDGPHLLKFISQHEYPSA